MIKALKKMREGNETVFDWVIFGEFDFTLASIS